MQRKVLFSAVAGVCASLVASTALASSYASGITTGGGNVNFVLNADATEVFAVRDGTPTSLGALTRGPQSFALSGASTYSIRVVNNLGLPGYQDIIDANVTILGAGGNPTGLLGATNQLSDDSTFLQFERPVGMAINKNPATPDLFGRIYVSNPRNISTGSGRTMTDGVYVVRADYADALGQGNTALTGGIAFDTGSTGAASPWDLALDDDGNVYIGDWSDTVGSVYRTGPDVTGGVNMLTGVGGSGQFQPTAAKNHGSIGGFDVRGSLANGTLRIVTQDEDLSFDGTINGVNSIWTYHVGSTSSDFNGIPTTGANPFLKVQGVLQHMEIGNNGLIYAMQSRANGQETDIYVMSEDGSTVLYDSLADSILLNQDGFPTGTGTLSGVQDALRSARAVATSPDNRWMAVATSIGGDVWMVPLLGGLPDIANRIGIDTFTGSTNDSVEFDAAGNLYVGNRSDELVRVFSPGGFTVTEWSSNGTFVARNEPDFNGSGNYSDTSKWLLGVVPNAADGYATVGNVSTGAQTLTVDSPIQLARLRLAGGNYTVGGATITMGAGFSEPRLIAESGSHTVSAPLDISKNVGYSANTGASLTVTNPNYAAGSINITKWGGGVVTHPAIRQDNVLVRDGTLRIASGAGVSKVATLGFGSAQRYDYSGGTLTIVNESRGTLDVTNNGVVVTATPVADIAARLTTGYAGGAWNGQGINSSTAAGLPSGTRAVGSGVAGDQSIPPGLGEPVSPTDVLIRYTRAGDANLDGTTGIADFSRLAANFNQPGVWSTGDFNYDGNTNIADFSLLAANFNLSASDAGARPGAVPEPASLGLLALAAGVLVGRRARRA